jgi:hypothetical protein
MRHALLAAALAAALAAPSAAIAQSAPAPSVGAGDTWTYRGLSYNRLPLGEVTREVTGTGGEIRVVTRAGSTQQTAEFARPGFQASGPLNDRATGTLAPALEVMPFPLEPGKRWTQTVQRRDPASGEMRTVRLEGRVVGWETVRVPAGEFRAIKVERRMWLGDWDQFRGETWRAETEWYVPEVRGPVKVAVFEEYPAHRYSLFSFMPGDRYTYELTSFKRG